MDSDLSPFLIHPLTEEPYLRLAAPHDKIIVTPPRLEDAAAITRIMNDPRVCIYLASPPYPYKLEYAHAWIAKTKKVSDNVIREMQLAAKDLKAGRIDEMPAASGCPVHFLREQNTDGSEIFIGDMSIVRNRFHEFMADPAEQKRLSEANETLGVGDPRVEWISAYFLSSDYHGRGIMSAALSAILKYWAVPRMHVKIIRATTTEDNVGSARVLEKDGFAIVDKKDNCLPLPENKGGGKITLNILEWSFDRWQDLSEK